jgi:hypothetical protein
LQFEMTFLGCVGEPVANQVRGINRVAFDPTPTAGTIKWEQRVS